MFAKTKSTFMKKIQYFFEILSLSDPSIYTMDYPDIIACSFMENSIGPKRIKSSQDKQTYFA